MIVNTKSGAEVLDDTLDKFKIATDINNPDTQSRLNQDRQFLKENANKFTDEDKLGASLFVSVDKDPDHAGKILNAAQQSGLPASVVSTNLQSVQKQNALNSINTSQVRSQSPATYNFASDPLNADASHDDIKNLSLLEWFIKTPGRQIDKTLDQTELNDLNYEAAFNDLDTVSRNRLAELEMKTPVNLDDDSILARGYTGFFELGTQFTGMGVAAAKGYGAAFPAGATAGAGLSVLSGGTLLVPAAVAGGNIAGAYGARANTIRYNFRQMVGENYGTFKNITDVNGEKIDPELAKYASVIAGTINAASETLGAAFVLKQFPGAKDIMDSVSKERVKDALRDPTKVKKIMEFGKSYLEGGLGEVSTEMFQHAVSIFAEGVIKDISKQDFAEESLPSSERFAAGAAQVVDTGIETAKMMLFFGSVGPSASAAHNEIQIKSAQRDQKKINDIINAANNSKLKGRAPEPFRELVRKQGEGTDAAVLYIEPERLKTLYDEMDDNDKAIVNKAIPDLEVSIKRAFDLGEGVSIPSENYLTDIAGTNVDELLQNDLKFNPAKWSSRDVVESFSAMGEDLVQRMQAAVQDNPSLKTFDTELIEKMLVEGLVAQGRPIDIARSEVKPLVNYFKVQAEREGTTPLSIYEAMSVQVGSEQSPESVSTFDQKFEQADIISALNELSKEVESSKQSNVNQQEAISNRQSISNGQSTRLKTDEQAGIERQQGRNTRADTRGRVESGRSEQSTRKSSDNLRTVTGKSVRNGWAGSTRVRDNKGKLIKVYRGSNGVTNGLGVWFTTRKDEASALGNTVDEVYLDMRKVKKILAQDIPVFESDEEANKFREGLRSQGFEGIAVDMRHFSSADANGTIHFIAFDPDQAIPASASGQEKSFFHDREKKARARASIRFTGDGKRAIIDLFKDANLASFLHESGHFFLESFMQIANKSKNVQTRKDAIAIKKWMIENSASIAEWVNEKTDSKNVTAEDVAKQAEAGDFSDNDIGRGMHEYFARGFEAYISEGKSPSVEMVGVFGLFKEWLKRTYKDLSRLNVNLSPDIRGVMDRMIATDKEIAEAQSLGNFIDNWVEAQKAGFTKNEYDKLVKESAIVAEKERNDLFVKAQKQAARINKTWWKKARAKIRKNIVEEFDNSNVWNVIEFLKEGNVEGANIPKELQGLKLSREDLVSLFGEDYLATLPKPAIYQKFGGISAHDLSDIFGFDNPKDMLESIKDALRVKRTAKERADASSAQSARDVLKRVRTTDKNKPKSLEKYLGYVPESVQVFIRNNGGIFDEGGDLKSRELRMPGLLMPWNGSNGVDDWALRLVENNYLQAQGYGDDGYIIRAELDDVRYLIESSVKGDNIYDRGTEEKLGAYYADLEDAETLAELGVTEKSSDADINNALENGIKVPEGSEKRNVKKYHSKESAIEAATDDRMEFIYGDIFNDGTLATEAMDSVMSDDRGKLIETEFNLMLKMTESAIKFSNRRDAAAEAMVNKIDRTITAKAARAIARKVVMTTKIRDLKPFEYQALAERFNQKAKKAIARRDFSSAAYYKQSQLINHYRYIEARDAIDNVNKAVKYFKSFDNNTVRSKVGVDHMRPIDTILEQYEFKKTTLREIDRRKVISNYIKKEVAAGNEVLISQDVIDQANTVNFKELDSETIYGIRDTVKNIEHNGVVARSLIASKRKVDLELNVKKSAESIRRNISPKKDRDNKWGDFVKWATFEKARESIHSANIKMEFLLKKLDGWVENGPTWTAIFKPIADAEDAENVMRAPLYKIIDGLLNGYTRAEKRNLFKKIKIEGIPERLTRQEIIMIGINCANEGNRKAALSRKPENGKSGNWTEAQLDLVLNQLTKKDIDVINTTIETIESLWPKIVQHEKDMTGLVPEKVEGSDLKIKNGTIKGGYFPLVGDPQKSKTFRAADFKGSVIGELESKGGILDNNGNFASASTSRGYTYARKEFGDQPLRLDFGVVLNHIDNVTHDLTHRKAVRDVNAIIKNHEFSSAVIDSVGKDLYDLMMPWLKAVARDENKPTTYVEDWIAKVRTGTTTVAMAWKFSTAFIQILGYTNTVDMIGAKYTAIGMKSFFKDGSLASIKEQVKLVREKSVMMKYRQNSFDRDVRQNLKHGKSIFPTSRMEGTYFAAISAMDTVVAMGTWMGAYEKGLNDFKNSGDIENQAVAYADSVVRMSQSSGSIKDLASFQRGGELLKMFTMFYTFFSALYGQIYRRVDQKARGDINFAQAFVSSLLLITVPAIMSELMGGRLPDEDDEETVVGHLAKAVLLYPVQTLPHVRDAVNSVFTDFEYSMTPLGKSFATLFATVESAPKIAEEGFSRKDVRNIINTVGILKNIPTGQGMITMEAAYDKFMLDDDRVGLYDFLMKDYKRKN